MYLPSDCNKKKKTPQKQSKQSSLKTGLVKFTSTGVITAVAAAPLAFTD